MNAGDWQAGKLHMVRPPDDPEIPWTALVVGLWIPNFFYWGLNQYITQRTLGSKSLAEGQRGVVFAAFLKLLIPFVVVIPGILAYNLFTSDLETAAVVKNAKAIATFAPDLYGGAFRRGQTGPRRSPLRQRHQGHQQAPRSRQDEPARGASRSFASPRSLQRAIPATPPHPGLQRSAVGCRRTARGVRPAEHPRREQRPCWTRQPAARATGAVHELVLRDYDAAFPVLIKNLLPTGIGLKGFVLAAIFGAVVSSLASMLNSSSTIFAMDIYRKIKKEPSQFELVSVGRICVVAFVFIAMLIAPRLDNPKFGGIFTFIQEFQGFISPGILSIFLFGVLVHRAPRACGTVGLIINPILYGGLKYFAPNIAFLNRMAICFFVILAVLGDHDRAQAAAAAGDPARQREQWTCGPIRGPRSSAFVVILLTLILYAIFW